MLRLLGRKTDGGSLVIYEGVSQIKPGEWNDVTFKLTDYAAAVASVEAMKIWVKSYDDKAYEGDYGLLIENVLLYARTSTNVLSIILWIILILFIAAVVGFFGLVARNQIRYRLRLRRQKQRAMQKELARRGQQVAYPPAGRQLPPGQTGAQGRPQLPPGQTNPRSRAADATGQHPAVRPPSGQRLGRKQRNTGAAPPASDAQASQKMSRWPPGDAVGELFEKSSPMQSPMAIAFNPAKTFILPRSGKTEFPKLTRATDMPRTTPDFRRFFYFPCGSEKRISPLYFFLRAVFSTGFMAYLYYNWGR